MIFSKFSAIIAIQTMRFGVPLNYTCISMCLYFLLNYVCVEVSSNSDMRPD
jgi:hypothetical protein